MKSTALVTVLAVAAAVLSLSAHAQTGRPSSAEMASASHPTPVAASEQQVGSYARYLMLNGATRDEALRAARNIDHPAPSKQLAGR